MLIGPNGETGVGSHFFGFPDPAHAGCHTGVSPVETN